MMSTGHAIIHHAIALVHSASTRIMPLNALREVVWLSSACVFESITTPLPRLRRCCLEIADIVRSLKTILDRKNMGRQLGPSIDPEGHTPRPFQLLPVIHWRKCKKMLASSVVGLTCRRAA